MVVWWFPTSRSVILRSSVEELARQLGLTLVLAIAESNSVIVLSTVLVVSVSRPTFSFVCDLTRAAHRIRLSTVLRGMWNPYVAFVCPDCFIC